MTTRPEDGSCRQRRAPTGRSDTAHTRSKSSGFNVGGASGCFSRGEAVAMASMASVNELPALPAVWLSHLMTHSETKVPID